ncbi:MAG: hypothetical protein ACRDYF_18040 [Acidimicrobiia bacterium]
MALHSGRVIAAGTPEAVLDDPEVAAAFLGNPTHEIAGVPQP